MVFWFACRLGVVAPSSATGAPAVVVVSPSEAELSPAPRPDVEAPAAGGPCRFGPFRRVRRSVEFQQILRSGERRSSNGYTIYIGRRTSGPARLGLLVSKRHSKLAVLRNGLKRCIREAFRLEQHRLGSVDILIRPPYSRQAGAAMLLEVRKLLVRHAR